MAKILIIPETRKRPGTPIPQQAISASLSRMDSVIVLICMKFTKNLNNRNFLLRNQIIMSTFASKLRELDVSALFLYTFQVQCRWHNDARVKSATARKYRHHSCATLDG